MNILSYIAKGVKTVANTVKKGVEKVVSKVKKEPKEPKEPVGPVEPPKKPVGPTKPPKDDLDDVVDKFLNGLEDKNKETFKNEFIDYMADSARLNTFYNESNLSILYYGDEKIDWEKVEKKVNEVLNNRDEFQHSEILRDIGNALYDTLEDYFDEMR